MNSNKKDGKLSGIVFLVLLIYLVSLVLTFNVCAMPEGANVEYVDNSTKADTPPGSRNDSKGTITTIRLSTVQQNVKWKAYVGNVSGTLVLRDSDSYSIYEWPSGGSPTGEVYIARNDSVDWASVECANSTAIANEQTELSHAAAASDNINNTFSEQTHRNFDVGIIPIGQSSCQSLITWTNNSAQAVSIDADFQEVLLMDGDMKLVYTALIDQDTSSYRDDSATGNTTYDFQALVPDYNSGEQATYYFYVEITS